MDLTTLYRTVIMDNYKNPKNKGLKRTDDYHFVHLNNPSCGDDMNVEILMKDAFRRTDEMTHIIVNVKSDKVGSQKSVQDLDPFGQNPEKFM